jgi:hypothetical protein
MKDMKISRKNADTKNEAGIPAAHDGPEYPHGLSVHLNHESLKKLGLHKDPPQVGDKLHLQAHAHVTSARQDANGEHHVELQLRKLDLKDNTPGEEEMHEGMHKAVDKAVKGGYDGAAEADGKAKAAR